jgi:hypothetical protein
MSLIKCKTCDGEMSRKAEVCPKCGHPNKEASYLSGGQVLGGLVLAGIVIWWLAGGGFDNQVAYDLAKVEDQVASDAVSQYNIAKQQGDSMQICIQASLVSAAYLQAKDETNYQTWKKTEAEDCKRAGVPQ